MPSVRISTTISLKYHTIAKDKNIPWSEALTRGVQELAKCKPIDEPGVEIEESKTFQLMKAKDYIEKELQKANVALEKEQNDSKELRRLLQQE